MDWMIYGANGYTGELIAREARRRGLAPTLAGRSGARIEALAHELGLPWTSFALDDFDEIARGITGTHLVLHCAGPFSATSVPMVAACLRARAHYLDISGEISVFEAVHARDDDAKRAGVVLCPGVGFDVVPTDCIAATLKAALPDATRLALGFDGLAAMSPGTAKTSVEGLAKGGRVRRNGRIEEVPLAFRTRRIDFGNGEKLAMTIPWGDVSTAYHSTGIANIEVFMPGSPRMVKMVQRANRVRRLLGAAPVQRFLKKRAGRARGPDDAARADNPTYVWGEVVNASGDRVQARIRTANGYALTITAALGIVEGLLASSPPAGATTPSRLMGSDYVCRLPGSGPIALERDRVAG